MSEKDSTPTQQVQHVIRGIKIDDKKINIECDCGWTSKKYKSEGDAREEFDAHQEAVNGSN